MSKQEESISCCITQCEKPLDQSYWNTRWQLKETSWDIGYASPTITEYMLGYTNKEAAILIPGCGNAHEADFLLKMGFNNITLIDIAPKAVELLKEKFANYPQIKILCEDFFNHNGTYDLLIEQTFFCAIPPQRRKEYAEKATSLLTDNGKIIGVLFNKFFEKQGPPFGGNIKEYQAIFEPHFTIKKMEPCYNSIPPRANAEVFINLVKKQNEL